jgi:hypothetical protein
LSSGADILGSAMISHHVLLTAMCGNFLDAMMVRDAALRGIILKRKHTGLSAGHG